MLENGFDENEHQMKKREQKMSWQFMNFLNSNPVTIDHRQIEMKPENSTSHLALWQPREPFENRDVFPA